MADNVTITPGSGNIVAADELTDATLGTVKVQYVKLMDGTIDGTNKAAVGANGLKVDGSGVTQPISGTTTANQGGTWTVQPGNTANTTAWKVDGSAVTQPISGAVTSNQGTSVADTSAWPIKSGVVAATTATWTSATASNTTLALPIIDYGTVEFSAVLSGTITGGVIQFEASDDAGTTWFAITGVSSGGTVSATLLSLNGSSSTAYQTAIAGFTNFRLRLSSAITGTGSAVIRIQASAFPVQGNVVPTQNNPTSLRMQLGDATNNTAVTALNALKVDTSTTASSLAITATGATGVAVTATLPAVAAQFHYITLIEITKYFTAANAASATPLIVTTTNLPGSMAYTFGQPLGTIGTPDERIYNMSSPLKSSVVNTATTIVCPATTGIIWRVNVYYYAAP